MKLLLAALLLISSGCIVSNPDRFQLGGEVRVETAGVLEYLTGFKLRVFGGILITKERRKDVATNPGMLPIDSLLPPAGR